MLKFLIIMNQIKFLGNICKYTNNTNLLIDLKNYSIEQMLSLLDKKFNFEQSFLKNENLLIAVNNIEVSVLNNTDTIIKDGDTISIISVNHGG